MWRELRRINEEALDRMARRWERLPLPSVPHGETGGKGAKATCVGRHASGVSGEAGGMSAENPPRARDLDLFGWASVFHLLGTVRAD